MKLLSLLRSFERFVLVAILLTMVALYFLGVVARELGGGFASQLAWIEEAVRFLNVAMVFLALGLALERGRHVSIDTVRDRLPAPIRAMLLRLIDIVGLVFCLYLAWMGVRLAIFVLGTGQRSPTLDVPIGWIYLAPVIGFLLLGLRFALSLFGSIDRYRSKKAAGETPTC